MVRAAGVVSSDIFSKCVLLNARSLNDKLPEFYKLLLDDYSLVFVTESWLSETVTNSILDSTNLYTVYRKDRPYR